MTLIFGLETGTAAVTGSQTLTGYSHVESIAGGCALLGTSTSTQAYEGKSFNFHHTITTNGNRTGSAQVALSTDSVITTVFSRMGKCILFMRPPTQLVEK